MAKETEIKLRVQDLPAFRRRLKQLRARVHAKRVHEWNELFDTPKKELMRREQLLRIRTETAGRSATKNADSRDSERAKLTFKGPVNVAGASRAGRRKPGKYKVREEIELEVTDRAGLERIFQGLGMRVWFRYEKYRTTYRLPSSQRWAQRLLIEVDETPIGVFAELEGPERAIDQVAKALGYSQRDYITANYFVLYQRELRRAGKECGHMLFVRRRGR